ncbi:MAG: hypothetical protein U0P45_11170 [Acidimicrobiales bacterium]
MHLLASIDLKDPAGTLLVIAIIAFLAPLIVTLAPWLRLPALVLEIFLGILVGPQVLNLVAVTEPIQVISGGDRPRHPHLPGRLRAGPRRYSRHPGQARLARLDHLGGPRPGSRPHPQATDVVQDELYVGLALTTTALGALVPILQDAGLLDKPFGTHMLAIGSVGEFGPIIAPSRCS